MSEQRHSNATQKGFSLIELMIALTLGLLLLSSIGALFFANKRSYIQNNLIAEMQGNARYALQSLTRDLEMAGFLGGLIDRDDMQTTNNGSALPAPATDCGPGTDGVPGWAYDLGAIEFMNDVTVDAARAMFSCLQNVPLVASTDIISVRRVSGATTADLAAAGETANLQANTVYLRTNRTEASLFHSGADATNPTSGYPPNTAPMSIWEYTAHLYFIRADSDASDNVVDNIPTLCRAYLANAPTPTVMIEEVAEGVEDMQIAFGMDTDGDGVANQYIADPGSQALANDAATRAVTARIQLLMRARDEDVSYTNNKVYNFLGKDDDTSGEVDETGVTAEEFDGEAPQDGFYRRMAQTTIILRNPASARGIGVAP